MASGYEKLSGYMRNLFGVDFSGSSATPKHIREVIVGNGLNLSVNESTKKATLTAGSARASSVRTAAPGDNFLTPSGSTDYIVTNNVSGPIVDLNIQTTSLVSGDTVSIRLLAAQGSTTYISQAGKTDDLFAVTGLAVAADMTFFVRFDGTDLQRLTSVSDIVVDGRPVQRIATDSTMTVTHSGTGLDRVATLGAAPPSRFRLGITEWVESCGDSARLAGALSATAVGTGAGASHGTVTELDGCLNCTTGTTSTGEYRIEQSACSQVKLGHGELFVGFSVKTQGALSDATETYSLLFGATDTVSAAYTNAVCVKYTHSINGGRFQFETRYDGTSSLKDTGVAVGINVLYRIAIVGSADGTSVSCYINGSLVATSTTDIPVEARKMGVTARITKSAGTTARNYYLSQIKFRKENTYEAFDL